MGPKVADASGLSDQSTRQGHPGKTANQRCGGYCEIDFTGACLWINLRHWWRRWSAWPLSCQLSAAQETIVSGWNPATRGRAADLQLLLLSRLCSMFPHEWWFLLFDLRVLEMLSALQAGVSHSSTRAINFQKIRGKVVVEVNLGINGWRIFALLSMSFF